MDFQFRLLNYQLQNYWNNLNLKIHKENLYIGALRQFEQDNKNVRKDCNKNGLFMFLFMLKIKIFVFN